MNFAQHWFARSPLVFFLLSLSLVTLGCAGMSSKNVLKEDNIESYRNWLNKYEKEVVEKKDEELLAVRKEIRQNLDALLWKRARRQDSVAGYREYIGEKQTPVRNKQTAHARIDSLYWKKASMKHTAASYRTYINEPNIEHAFLNRAKKELDKLLWEEAKHANTPEAYEKYLSDKSLLHDYLDLAKEAHDKVWLEHAWAQPGHEELEKFPEQCKACSNISTVQIEACKRRVITLAPNLQTPEAREFRTQCSYVQKSVSDTASLIYSLAKVISLRESFRSLTINTDLNAPDWKPRRGLGVVVTGAEKVVPELITFLQKTNLTNRDALIEGATQFLSLVAEQREAFAKHFQAKYRIKEYAPGFAAVPQFKSLPKAYRSSTLKTLKKEMKRISKHAEKQKRHCGEIGEEYGCPWQSITCKVTMNLLPLLSIWCEVRSYGGGQGTDVYDYETLVFFLDGSQAHKLDLEYLFQRDEDVWDGITQACNEQLRKDDDLDVPEEFENNPCALHNSLHFAADGLVVGFGEETIGNYNETLRLVLPYTLIYESLPPAIQNALLLRDWLPPGDYDEANPHTMWFGVKPNDD